MHASALFSGCATALVTPFLPNGSIDEIALRHLILLQLDSGVDALVLLGTTGEPCTLSMKERETVIRIGLETTANRIPVIVGTGSNDTRRAIDYARQAKKLGAHGQLCVTPYYNKTTQQGLIRHYEAILTCCDLPMILYHVPGRTGMGIHPETAASLALHPNVVGIKDAGGDLAVTKAYIAHTHGQLPVYCGCDDQIASMMELGAEGAISVISNICPLQTHSITSAALSSCTSEAMDAQNTLMPLIQLLSVQVNPIPIKAALAMLGLIHDVLRLPLTSLEEPYRSRIFELLQHLNMVS